MSTTTQAPSSAIAAAAGMRRTTSIEWTEHTWNPFVGCLRVSEGCRHCYAERMAARLQGAGMASYAGTIRDGRWSGQINRSSETAMRKPHGLPGRAVVFVNSMSDFWHPGARDAWREEALRIIEATPQHTYQILTKRPELIAPTLERLGRTRMPDNVWLGATVEDARVASRLEPLRRAPARVRFISVEPMTAALGPVDLSGIRWVITGGESGPGARICRAEWVREVGEQCSAQGVVFFHKQWGRPENNPISSRWPSEKEAGETLGAFIERIEGGHHGKGGAWLDGRLWREMPAAA